MTITTDYHSCRTRVIQNMAKLFNPALKIQLSKTCMTSAKNACNAKPAAKTTMNQTKSKFYTKVVSPRWWNLHILWTKMEKVRAVKKRKKKLRTSWTPIMFIFISITNAMLKVKIIQRKEESKYRIKRTMRRSFQSCIKEHSMVVRNLSFIFYWITWACTFSSIKTLMKCVKYLVSLIRR